ncbi:MAG: WbqC family protein [Thermoanaerobaculia bacterium]|nr:WbqC family protein [Thermoanaerobaculia bacterium]
MKVAVMQPYFFPYIGYFQLIRCVDKFVVFDDVNFIKKGWINRNRILVNGAPFLFSIPLKQISQNKWIRDTEVSDDPSWMPKFLKTLESAYKKAPNFNHIYPAVERLLQEDHPSIAGLNVAAIRFVCDYLDIDTALIPSSTIYANNHLKGQERVLDICRQEGAETYINPAGGSELYDHAFFEENGVQLFFIRSEASPYKQFGHDFFPYLSMLDCLMFADKAAIKQMLSEFQLVTSV